MGDGKVEESKDFSECSLFVVKCEKRVSIKCSLSVAKVW